MKPQIIIAIALIAIGILAFVYQGITYKTAETAIDLGPLKVTTEKTHTIPLPPVLGFVGVIGGIILLVAARPKA